MKALVLSGGSGVRLRPITYAMPKQLIPIANKPILEHVLDNVRSLGVTETGVVVGEWESRIAESIGDGSRFGMSITYIRQDRPLGLAHAVQVAQPFLGAADFLMYLADNVLADGIAGYADEFRGGIASAHVLVHKVSDPRAFGVAELGPEGTVLRLVEKPMHPRSDLALIGVYFFTPAIHEAIASIAPSKRGELEITDAIQWLVARGSTVNASRYDGYWRDAGELEDVLDCNRLLLSRMRSHVAGSVDGASRLAGDVVVMPGAQVIRSTVEGPAIIGAGTLIEDSRIGPHTAVGSGSLLRAARIRDSIVLDGAQIIDSGNLSGCLIGRFAMVGPQNERGVSLGELPQGGRRDSPCSLEWER